MHEPKGHPLRLDPDAVSANPEHPPFVARPPGAPVFHGFPVLEDVEVEGFKLGMISDWEAEPSDYGDAFVVAPDGSRAGLMWVFDDQRRVREVRRSEPDRWGVWEVSFPHPDANASGRSIQPRVRAARSAAEVGEVVRDAVNCAIQALSPSTRTPSAIRRLALQPPVDLIT